MFIFLQKQGYLLNFPHFALTDLINLLMQLD